MLRTSVAWIGVAAVILMARSAGAIELTAQEQQRVTTATEQVAAWQQAKVQAIAANDAAAQIEIAAAEAGEIDESLNVPFTRTVNNGTASYVFANEGERLKEAARLRQLTRIIPRNANKPGFPPLDALNFQVGQVGTFNGTDNLVFGKVRWNPVDANSAVVTAKMLDSNRRIGRQITVLLSGIDVTKSPMGPRQVYVVVGSKKIKGTTYAHLAHVTSL